MGIQWSQQGNNTTHTYGSSSYTQRGPSTRFTESSNASTSYSMGRVNSGLSQSNVARVTTHTVKRSS